MNMRVRAIAASAMLVGVGVLGWTTAMAAHPGGDTCMDIQWSEQLLKMYPRAPAACQEVAVRNGKKYARFTGKVTSVGPDLVKVRFTNVAGDPGREISVKPGPNAMVEMAGKKVEYSKLQKDDVLTFWVPERDVGVISDPDAKASATLVLP